MEYKSYKFITFYKFSVTVGLDGFVVNGEASMKTGIRPAFYLRNTVAIGKSDTVIDGQTVYAIVK